jgi:hypothetical protein
LGPLAFPPRGEFLVEQGWRPGWRQAETASRTAAVRLAECVGDLDERDRCRAAAWRFAERYEDVQRLGGLLGHP